MNDLKEIIKSGEQIINTLKSLQNGNFKITDMSNGKVTVQLSSYNEDLPISIDEVRNYCMNHDKCMGCRLEKDDCLLQDQPPYTWDTDKIRKLVRGE